MASQKRDSYSKNVDVNSEVLQILISLFGDVLHTDIIKSVASACDWKLETASNMLAEISANASNGTITSKRKPKNVSSNVNTVGYAAAGDDDNNVDVYIEEEKDHDKNKVDFRRALTNQKKVVNIPIKLPPNKITKPKPIQNKSKRELEYDRVRNFIRSGAKVCILLRGLPGSGKTHLARLIIQTTLNEDYRRFVFSTDEYFERNGTYNYNPILLSDAHLWNQKRVFESMLLGISPIIIDNTNTQMWEMKCYSCMAVQHGYAIEILEPMTVWVFNPSELARRNIHRVPKNKIVDMLDRYEKNITLDKLFKTFDLRYAPHNTPPQPRLYPPFSSNIGTLFNIPRNIIRNSIINKNEPSPSVVKPKRKRSKKKKSDEQNLDTASVLSKSESTHSILTNDSDSDNDSLNELQKSDSGYSLNVRDILTEKEIDNIQIEKNLDNESADLIDFIDFEDNAIADYSSNIIALENDKAKSNEFSQLQGKTQQVIDSCVKLFNAITTKDNKQTDCCEKNLSSANAGNYPKIDLLSWGLPNDVLSSWELVNTSNNNAPLPQRQVSRERETKISSEIGTNTCSEDFALLKKDFSTDTETKIIPTNNRNIGENCLPVLPRSISKVSLFDKSTMTGREDILNAASSKNRCANEAQHFSELVNLFPTVEKDVLKDIFDKCQGDINWAVDLLLDENKDLQNSEPQLLDVAGNHIHTINCDCISNYDTKVFIPAKPKEESPITTPDFKKNPLNLKNRVSEESLLLKKQLEGRFKINETYYSPYISNIRTKRYGEQASTSLVVEPEEAIVNDIDDHESSEDSSEDEIIEMNVGLEFIEQLEKTVGYSEVNYPRGFQPVMHLPTSVVRLLHTYWLESVYQQMDNQSHILETMLHEDEELARKLQEQEAIQTNGNPVIPNFQEVMDMEIALAIYKADQEQWKNETPDNLASRMKQQKLFETFPSFDHGALLEVLQACNNNFDQTVEILMSSIDPDHAANKNSLAELAKQNELIQKAKKESIQAKEIVKKTPKIVVKGSNSDEDDEACCSSLKSPNQYREEAAHHLQMRHMCFTKAQIAIQKGHTQVATYYSEIAQMHKQKYEQANSFAASAFLSVHSRIQNPNTLDLHFLYVKEAEQALAMFIDEHISNLKSKNKSKVNLFVITGRGSHSKDGISHIKPVVKRHLKNRNLNFVQMNPGLLRITVHRYSVMTNDLK